MLPIAGLDPASRRALWACVKEAKKTRSIFLTTHSMEEAEELCDRVSVFVDGNLQCIDEPKVTIVCTRCNALLVLAQALVLMLVLVETINIFYTSAGKSKIAL